MADEYFKKRAGTTDRGKNYEDLFIANIIIDFILDDDILDFKISSNDENFGAFDDIVLEIIWKNGDKENYALQLKHSSRPLTLKNLIGKSGDFSIKKYFENFIKLKETSYKWVLLTNRSFNYKENEAQIRLEGDDFDLQILRYLGEPHFMKFCQKRSFYQFSSILKMDNTDSDPESCVCLLFDVYKEFFQKFYLCTDQLDVVKIEEVALEKFRNSFSCDKKIFRDYYKFITDWSLKEGKKMKLSKPLMKQIVTNQLLAPFVKIILPSNTLNDDQRAKMELFQNVISKFHTTYFKDTDFKILENFLGYVNHKFRQKKDVLKDLNICGIKHQTISRSVKDITSLTDEEINLLLWMTKHCHLVVTEHESVSKALDLSVDHKFIILGQPNHDYHQGSVFQCLSDIRHIDVFEDVARMFKCQLQGKQEIPFDVLLRFCPKVEEIVTTSQFLQMVNHSLIIGEEKEDLPVPYIRRSLSRPIIDFQFLNYVKNDTLVIISGLQSPKVLEKRINTNINIINVEDLLLDSVQTNKSNAKNVYVCRSCSQTEFDEICNLYKNCKCHQFKFDNENLEWVRSNSGGITDLKKFLIQNHFLNEEDLLKCEEDNSINIICAEAGMGKTVLLKNLKNSYSPEFWTILIYPKDHSKYFRENKDNEEKFVDYYINKISEKYTNFDKKLLKIFYEEKRVNFFWDALDETSDENLQSILSIIDKFLKKGYKQWITSRSNLETLLESRFSVVSRTLKEFDEDEQRRYMGEKLSKYSQNGLEDILQKINKNVQMFRYNKVLGIPLQIYMFTELLLKDLHKYKKLLDRILSLSELYECFVDEKFNVLHEDKENFDGMNDMIYKRNKEYKEDRLQMYEKVAMKLHFPNGVVEEDINCQTFLAKVKINSDSVGLITGVTEDNLPNFWHNSYGEYFAASFLSKNIKLFQTIIKPIFNSKLANIRFFFDLIMAKGRSAHLSVLYKNLDSLRSCGAEEIRRKDELGRNPLQLACSWGEQFLDLHPEKHTKWIFFLVRYRVYGIFAESVKRDSLEFCQVLEELMEKIDPRDKDVFGLDSFTYADCSRCLVPLSLLSKRYQIPFDSFDNFKNPATILYYAAFFDLPDLLHNELPIVEDEFGTSALFIAVKNGSFNCFIKLIRSSHYRKVMEDNTKELVKIAFDNKHYKLAESLLNKNQSRIEVDFLNHLLLVHIDSNTELIQLLVKNGAQINIANEDGATPLHLACLFDKLDTAKFLISRGAKVAKEGLLRCCGPNPEMTKLLIQNGASVNIANADGKTPIQHAAESNFFETLKILVDNGAKVNEGDRMGCRPIHYACIKGRVDVIEKLVGSGADVNVANDFGFTPLHYACGQQHEDVVDLLVMKGAVVDAQCNSMTKGNQRIVELLEKGKGQK